MVPAWHPGKIMCINRPEFADYMSLLAKVFDVEFQTFEGMKKPSLNIQGRL